MKSLNIRKKLVTLAVASIVSGGAMMAMTAPAHAMNVSQNNVGQVLLFPYYTVKNGLDTIFTVTNTSDKTAVFKVRFREALNSREVRDFNVILSPYDHWSAGVTDTDTGGALVRTFDNTCTSPILPASATVSGAREVSFSNALLATDGGGADIGRVQEGYFEVILMGVSDRPTTDPLNVLEYNAKHVSGMPRDCAKVDALFLDAAAINGYMDAPENVLKGHVTYINVDNGTAIDAEPTAIENFQTTTSIVYAASDLYPDLANGDVDAPVFFLDNGAPQGGNVVGTSQHAVTALLAANSVVNEFATGAGASTSWVLTFPTKHHYTDNAGPMAPFSERFDTTAAFNDELIPLVTEATGTIGKSCDNIGLSLFNREEGTVQSVDNTQFSPAPAGGAPVALCYEVNVVDFNSSSVFGAGTNRLAVDTSGVGTAGWAQLSFTEAAAIVGANGVQGLPTIGFSATVRDAGGAAVNYGSSTEHTIVRGYVAP